MNEVDKVGIKTKSMKGIWNKTPLESIKSFSLINFEHEGISIPVFKVKRMDDLLSDDDIRRNMPMSNESRLSLANIIGEILLAKDLAIIL